MQRRSFEDMNCSVAQCLEVVGEWWSLLIVRDAVLGVRRFDDFQARSHCGEDLSLRSVTLEPGPGAQAADLERTCLARRST